jgi:hypothetical protein
LNPRPSGYEPDELPGCSTPRSKGPRKRPLNKNYAIEIPFFPNKNFNSHIQNRFCDVAVRPFYYRFKEVRVRMPAVIKRAVEPIPPEPRSLEGDAAVSDAVLLLYLWR